MNELSYGDLIKSIGNYGLKCGHLNVNGLYHKLDEVKVLLEETKFDILALTETHLQDAATDSEIAIEGYMLFRKDRTRNKKWGGTLIYYREHLNVHELSPDTNMDKLEAIWIEVIVKSQKLLVASVYRPPDQKDFLKHLTPVLDRLHTRSNIVLLGDFNIDMSFSSKSPLRFEFTRLLSKFNLQNVIKYPTRITDRSSTTIDLAIVSSLSKIKSSGSYEAGISDHNLIYITLNILNKNPPPKVIWGNPLTNDTNCSTVPRLPPGDHWNGWSTNKQGTSAPTSSEMQRLLSGKKNSKKLTQQTSFGQRSKSSKESPKRQSLDHS